MGADVAAVVIFKPVTDPEILKQLNEDDPKFDNKAAAANKSKRVEFRGESIRFPVEVTDEESRAVLARDYPWASVRWAAGIALSIPLAVLVL